MIKGLFSWDNNPVAVYSVFAICAYSGYESEFIEKGLASYDMAGAAKGLKLKSDWSSSEDEPSSNSSDWYLDKWKRIKTNEYTVNYPIWRQ